MDKIGEGACAQVFSGTYYGAPVAMKNMSQTQIAAQFEKRESSILDIINYPCCV